jgi:signal transduction histidine kinase
MIDAGLTRTRDEFEQLRLVAELSSAVDRFELANHQFAHFARTTAHDLIAPLAALSSLLDLMSDRGADPDFMTSLDAIRSAIGRTHTMVDRVMGYAESLEATPKRTPVNVDDSLGRVLDALGEEIRRRDAVITCGSLPTVHGNEQQLECVLLNLVANALKFGGQPPHVRVEANREHDAWRISVTDDGIGVPEKQRAGIFQLFAGGDRNGAGRGVSLATSRRVVELHGGRIWVEPNKTGGSSFHFTVPNEPAVASTSC